MSSPDTFKELLGRVRAGDERAVTELVRQFEPAIRRAARVRMSDPRLGRMLDSMDICQSVMASFFVRAASGVYELESPEQLMKLLATMARNELANQANRLRAARRDQRRVEGGGAAVDVAGHEPSASVQVAARELLDEVHRRLTPEERSILERREQGSDWAEIATALGGTPEALRKRYARGIDRGISKRLQILLINDCVHDSMARYACVRSFCQGTRHARLFDPRLGVARARIRTGRP